MTLRVRVFAGLALLLALTVVAAWFLTGGAVLRPLIGSLGKERLDMALYIAEEIEKAEDPLQRALELGEAMQVDIRLSRGHGQWAGAHRGGRGGREVERDGRVAYQSRGDGSRVMVPLKGEAGEGTMVVRFPADLEDPPRKVGLGLLLLGVAAVLAAVGMSRWVLHPLELTSEAMRRVADGDLDHRVPTAADAAGQMASTFNRMAETVQSMVRGQRELMAAVSHELRTPLARMRLQAELLREAGADPKRVDGLERDIDAIDDLVGELLESARLDQGVLALSFEAVALDDLAAEALGSVDLGEREVALDVPAALSVWADRKRLLRALVNLLSNVARYTSDGVQVEVRARPDGEEVALSVADRGPGVPPEALDRLFEPFFRAEASRSRRTGGLGVGLMLVRQIVVAHGGRVDARNRDGGGLEVTLRLPARPQAP